MDPTAIFLRDDMQAYQLSTGEAVWCLATVHVTGARGRHRFNWRRKHPVIDAFIADPEQAAAAG
jgi:hypothetical protein